MVLVKTQAHRSINRIESPEIKKSGVYNEERITSLIDGDGKSGELPAEKMQVDHYLTLLTKINLNELKI